MLKVSVNFELHVWLQEQIGSLLLDSISTVYLFTDYVMTLTINGTDAISLPDVEPYFWNGTEQSILYLGKSSTDYYTGYIDEVRGITLLFCGKVSEDNT